MVATVAAHEHPFFFTCVCDRGQMAGHVTGCVNKIEAAIAKEVVRVREWSYRGIRSEFQLLVVMMIKDVGKEGRVWMLRETWFGERRTARPGNYLCVWKFGAITSVIKVEVTEDHRINLGGVY